MTIITNEIESLVASFAKDHKQSKAKLLALVEAAINKTPKPCSNAGRKVTPQALKARTKIEQIKDNFKGKKFTIKDVEAIVNADESSPLDYVTISNQVNYLAAKGLFVKAGFMSSGGVGRPQSVWSVV